MTVVSASLGVDVVRHATPRRYVMCPPRHFWMSSDPRGRRGVRVDVGRAVAQWMNLRDVYRRLGHTVYEIEPQAGMPDLVFASGGGVVIGGRAVGSRFRSPERQRQADAHHAGLARVGVTGWQGGPVRPPEDDGVYLEGEGDVAVAGDVLVLGTGFGSSPAAADELADAFGLDVVVLELTEPSYPRLDVAFAVLDAGTVAYHPDAFNPASRQLLAARFPDALLVDAADAQLLALNAVSDGRHVILPRAAAGFAAQVADRGFDPIGVDLSELRAAGRGPKCCTLELVHPLR